MTHAVILLATVMAATSVGAAEIKVLSAGAVEPGLRAFAQLVHAQTGHDLAIQFNTAPRIAERLGAGETFDILISPPAVIDQAIRNGKVVAESRIAVGRVGVGIVVRSDAPAPDVATVDALKQSLLGTDAVVYNTASTGLYLDRLFEKMGVLDQLKPKTTRYADGAAVMEHLLKTKGNVLGFGAMTEIRQYEPKALRLVGPLPADVQNHTSYEAALMTGASAAGPAKAALAILATPAGRAAFASAGVE
jgi:molybdate transport system substrate-binding protein